MSPRDKRAKQQEKQSQDAGQQAAEAVADRTGVGEAKTDPDAVRQDIRQTREELGDTVEALAGKADVKGQAKAKAGEVRERVSGVTPEGAKRAAAQAGSTAQERPVPAIALAFGLGLVTGWLIKRR
jgi:ElaB/YqjD/DUF883 family membrane-anchored ribosome-binding protein